MGRHTDDEKELGESPIIASIGLGQELLFYLRHKYNKELRGKILLGHGSLLLMYESTQHHWKHQIPKTTKADQGAYQSYVKSHSADSPK